MEDCNSRIICGNYDVKSVEENEQLVLMECNKNRKDTETLRKPLEASTYDLGFPEREKFCYRLHLMDQRHSITRLGSQ